MKIIVLAGGLSPERDVSLTSGGLIANSLRRSGHRVFLLDVYLGANVAGDLDSLFTGDEIPVPKIAESAPDLDALKAKSGNGDALIGKNVIDICRYADLTFVALHGAMGENGQLQATLDCFGIKYTGSGYAGSLLAMDKDLTKRLLRGNGIPTADWITVDPSNCDVRAIGEKIGYPCVIKPCGCGSSVGVSIVRGPEETGRALKDAARYENKVMVEKLISGREFSIGVLKGRALPPVEIIPKSGFYDYKNKYQAGMTEEICPAKITDGELERISESAVAVHKTLGLGSYSRADFILDEKTGEFMCLEANNLPGMTPTSLLPQGAAAAGISYDELCRIIADCAI